MNMKKYILTTMCMMCAMMWFVSAASLQDTMTAREQRTSIDQGTIDKWSLIDTALAMLDRSCALDTWMNIQVSQNVKNTLTEIGLTLTKDTAPDYYKAYQQWHEAAATYTSNTQQYCAYKIAAYQLQQRFYLVYKGRADAVNPVRTSYEYRVRYFDTLKKLNHYDIPSSIKPYLSITVANRSQVLKFHPITKMVASQMSLLYRNIVAQSLKNLEDDKILTHDDVVAIGSKIVFNYVEQCSELRGLTKVTLSRNSAGRTVDGKLTSITFNVNVCEDMSYMDGFDDHIKSLVYHELAHYIYYLKDTTTSSFASLCRSGSNNACSRSDFVSDYSQNAIEEDYAETFQYWYQGTWWNTSNKLISKFQYFDDLFGKRTQGNVWLSNSKS